MSFVFESRLVGFRANSEQDVIYGYLTWKNSMTGFLSMDWVAKSYFGRAMKEIVMKEFLRILCLESRLVGFRANFVQHVIYGYLTWKHSVNDIL